ncbi:MAG: lytic transglycosylase domain-containing protein [Negativicutes bacterium]|nr:lytic transglycosylase domain-containing protein [Negativicutes bacterium]
MRIFKWLRALVLTAVLLAAVGYGIYSSDWFQKNYVYPFPHKETVFRYAKENGLDPYLVAGVIRTESRFVPVARSPKGAVGLMQMMPETGQWVATQMNYPNFSAGLLTDPEVNIKFGTWYMASLRREFQNNQILALAAYNGGRGNVRQWMVQYGWTVDFKDISQIPFPETRDYVKKVLASKERYRELYGK